MYEQKENQVWTEKGEGIAPPTSYMRERAKGRERESAVVVLEIGRHELYVKRVKCFKTLSAFVFHPSEPRTSLKRSYTSRPGMEMLLIPTLTWRLDVAVQWRNGGPSAWLTVALTRFLLFAANTG